MADSDPHIQPGFDGVVGPIITAESLDGKQVRVVVPGFATLDPDTGAAVSPGSSSGLTYTDASIPSLSANQVAGTTSILAANAARKALVINPPADCGLSLTAGGPVIWPLFGGVPNSFSGQDCPKNALFLTTGLTAGQALPMAVA